MRFYICIMDPHDVRILVIRFSSIGDVVLTTPVVRCLKRQLEGNVHIDYLTKSAYATLLEPNPYIDEVITIEKSTAEVAEKLKANRYDYIVDLHRNIRSAQVKRKLKIIDFTLDKLNVKKWLLVNFGVDKLPDVHIVDRYLEAIAPLGTENDGDGLDYFFPDGVEVPTLPNEYVSLVIGAKQPGKTPRIPLLQQIVDGADLPVVLVGGPEDVEQSNQINGSNDRLINLVGQLDLHGSAKVLEGSRVVVAPDTGMMHVAAALGKPVISLWGCTVPKLGMYPYMPGEGSAMIEPPVSLKRPCSKLGDKCKNNPNCIEQLDPNEIVRLVNGI